MLKSFYFLFLLILTLLLSSCVSTPSVPNNMGNNKSIINNQDKLNLRKSNNGKYLYGILVNKQGDFVKKISPNESYNKSQYELIKIYENDGVYPSYEPSDIENHKNSIFRDSTFDSLGNLNQGGVAGKVVSSTDFDEDKFLSIAKKAVMLMEENTKFAVRIKANENTSDELSLIEVEIDHKPSINLNKTIFSINKSKMYSREEPQIINVSRILQKRIYRLGTPTGKNEVKAMVSSKSGEKDDAKIVINNTFKAKPTFHVVSIGVNKFPNWSTNLYLENAVNDANYVKTIFNNKSKKLFGSNKVNIKPYSLSINDTTKHNIEALIQRIRTSVKSNDYFLFYVASHGLIEDNKYYFATSDYGSKKEYTQNNIDENQISEYLMKIPTIFRIAILDTCHSGKQVNVIKNDMQKLSLGRKEGISILTAAKTTQTANDGYKDTKHGLFTWVLVEGLNGAADADKNSIVDSIEIAEYLREHVIKKSKEYETNPMKIQEAVVFPLEKDNVSNRRFNLTYLEKKEYRGDFNPNVFTPRESQLYINAINNKNSSMMNGLRRNNTRHRENKKTVTLDSSRLTVTNIINILNNSGSVDILFNTGSDKLSDNEVSKIAQALNSNALKDKKIILEGHTDSTGDSIKNMELSQRRAESTFLSLKNSAIGKKRLVTIGFGDMYPIASNDTKIGKKQNRRVSIFIYD